MIAVKGEGVARAEQLAQSVPVTIDIELIVELPSGVIGVADRTPPLTNVEVSSWPNPFNPFTTIGYSIPKAGVVYVRVYDVKGRLVRTLVNGYKSSDQHVVTWDGCNAGGAPVASGIYFVRLESGGHVATKKIALLK